MIYIDYFEQWYTTYRTQGRRRVSVVKYKIAADHIRNHPIGIKSIKKINRMDLQNFMNNFGATHARQTTTDFHSIIKASFVDALTDGFININPCIRIEVNSMEKTLPVHELKALREKKKWLEFDEYEKLKNLLLQKLNDSLLKQPFTIVPVGLGRKGTQREKAESLNSAGKYKNQMVTMIIYVALKTGMRFSEILGLTIEDIDFENGLLNIDKTWDYKFDYNFKPTKNFASVRKIAVDNEFLEIMRLYIDWLIAHDLKIDQFAMFIEKGIKIYNSTINDNLKLLFLELDIEYISLHKLRHTQASVLLAKRISPQVVAKRLGHTDTKMIQMTYGHLLKSVEEEETEKMMMIL
ncbi:MAG TPA: site-specific integrase [Candidatus Paenibacillus intestinavium]|nr:site-specific integrase [Candidatus Paenibacillus intestinavium]